MEVCDSVDGQGFTIPAKVLSKVAAQNLLTKYNYSRHSLRIFPPIISFKYTKLLHGEGSTEYCIAKGERQFQFGCSLFVCHDRRTFRMQRADRQVGRLDRQIGRQFNVESEYPSTSGRRLDVSSQQDWYCTLQAENW